MELVAPGETRKEHTQEDIRWQCVIMPFYHLWWPNRCFL